MFTRIFFTARRYASAIYAVVVRLKVTFVVLNLCNTHNSGNMACLTTVCLHINWKVHPVCDLHVIFIVKGEGLLRVTGSHVHCKSGNILETVLDTYIVTTGN